MRHRLLDLSIILPTLAIKTTKELIFFINIAHLRPGIDPISAQAMSRKSPPGLRNSCKLF